MKKKQYYAAIIPDGLGGWVFHEELFLFDDSNDLLEWKKRRDSCTSKLLEFLEREWGHENLGDYWSDRRWKKGEKESMRADFVRLTHHLVAFKGYSHVPKDIIYFLKTVGNVKISESEERLGNARCRSLGECLLWGDDFLSQVSVDYKEVMEPQHDDY